MTKDNGLAVDLCAAPNDIRSQLERIDPRVLVWSNTRSIHEAIRLLFNAGYRGTDLVPPPAWPARLH